MFDQNQLMQMIARQGGSIESKETVESTPEIRKLLQERQKEQDQNMLIAGASGALGEFLFGGAGQIAGAGAEMAKGFMGRKQDLEDQEVKGLMASLKAKKSGMLGKNAIQRVYDPKTGKATLARVPYESGKGIEYLGVKPFLKEHIITTSEGRKKVFTPGDINTDGQVIGQDVETKMEGISPDFKKHMDVRVVPQFEAVIKADRTVLAELGNSIAMMEQGGVLPPMIALKSLAKALEGGKLTDKDFDIVMKPLSLKMSAAEWAETQKTGEVPQRLRREYSQAVRKLIDISKGRMKEYADKRVMSQGRTDNEKRALRKRLYGTMPDITTNDDLKRRDELLKKKAGK